jgi:hypothetical protein
MNILFYCLVTALITIPYASFFEWLLHRFVMHKPILGFHYAFHAHAQVHHKIFRADESYHLKDESDKETIPMAWWNGPVLVFLSSTPFMLGGWIFESWSIPATALILIASYYGTYEYIHWCMHLPKHRRVEFSKLFRWLNGHHVLHHRYPKKNFNVVCPFADLVFGTLLLLSPKPFEQVRGPSVPDVQPKSSAV